MGHARGLCGRKIGAAGALALVAALLALSSVTAASAAASSSSAASPSAAAPTGGLAYRIGTTSDLFDGMSPFSSQTAWEQFRVCYNFLTWYDADYRPVPDAAESWKVSPDGLRWTFHVRDDLTWSDGPPLTARDVAFTYNLILKTRHWMFAQYLTGVTSVTAPDDATVVITTRKPNAGMLGLYIPILPEHVWSKVDPAKLDYFKNLPMVSSGPFSVVEVKKSGWATLRANPRYPASLGGPPHVKTVRFEIYQTTDTMVADYRAGILDAVGGFTALDYKSLKKQPGTSVDAGPSIGFHQLSFNCWNSPKSKGNPLTRDVRIRQAVAWAIDRQKINTIATGGLATVGEATFGPAQPYWRWTPPAEEAYRYDPEKARQLLDAAGYVDRDGDGVRETAGGKPLALRLAALNEYPEDVSAAKMIVGWCRDVGIKLKLDQIDEGAFTDQFYDNANYDLFIWSWGGDIDPGFMLSTYTTAQIMNNSMNQYSNPEYDALFLQQAQALDPAKPDDRSKRRALVFKMQQILYRDCPDIVLWYNVNLAAYRTDRWTGYVHAPGPEGAPFQNMIRTTYQELRPRAATEQAASAGSSPAGWIVAGGVVVAVVAAVLLVLRRRTHAEEAD
jgi:peptide/nickel transport system substrate-binding protein